MGEHEFVNTMSDEKKHYFFAPETKLELTQAKSLETLPKKPTLSKCSSLYDACVMPETLKLTSKKSEKSKPELTFSRKFYTTTIIKEYATFIFNYFELSKKTGEINY